MEADFEKEMVLLSADVCDGVSRVSDREAEWDISGVIDDENEYAAHGGL